VEASEYTAIVLVAGCGSRLREVTDEPKSMLPVGDKIILHRHLRAFKTVGIRKVVLVVGYQKEEVTEAARTVGLDLDIKFVANDEYETKGNGVSLLMGLRVAKGPVVIFDGDLVYSPAVLARFIAGNEPNALVTGAASIHDIECTKALVDDSDMIRKLVDKRAVDDGELEKCRFSGEAFGMLRFSDEHRLRLLAVCEEFYSDPGNLLLNWESPLNLFLAKHDVASQFEESNDWIEIDTPEDYRAAQELALRLD